MSDIEPDMVRAGEFIVGTLIHAGIVKSDDAQRAVTIVAEELQVWLAIRDFNRPTSN